MLLSSQFFQRFDRSTYEGIQGSLGFWIPLRGFRIPDTEFQSLSPEFNLDSGSNLLWDSGFLELSTRIPKPRIPDSTSKCSLHSGFHKQKFIRFQFTRLLRDYYASALRSCYNVEDSRTGKTICLKCNYARTLTSRVACCF